MKGIGEGKEGKQNFSFTGVSLIISIISVTGIMFISSCTKTNEFTIGQDFFDSQTRLQVIDTFRVELSTILLDSIKTSATKKILVGSYKDDIFGSVKCESYFDLAYEAFSEIEEKAVFDSSVFIIPYNGYSYGDTTSLMSLSIHMLTEKITLFEDTIFITTSFSYLPEAVGTLVSIRHQIQLILQSIFLLILLEKSYLTRSGIRMKTFPPKHGSAII